MSEAGGGVWDGLVFLGLPVCEARDSCLVALWDVNPSVQSGITLCRNASLGHRGEIYLELRGVAGGI